MIIREGPYKITILDTMIIVKARSKWLRDSLKNIYKDDPTKVLGWKKLSIFYTLPYWKLIFFLMNSTSEKLHLIKYLCLKPKALNFELMNLSCVFV